MKNINALFVLMTVFFGGCASNPMQVSNDQELDRVGKDRSRVVFMRSSFVGSAINASVFDVTAGDPKFIGIIANGTKVAYEIKPGEHTFMVVSEAADYLHADLLPGKTYYSLVTPRMGAWKARFSLWPIRNDSTSQHNTHSKEFDSWLKGTKLVENSDASRSWAAANANSVKAKHAEYWPVWQKKTPAALAERTLNSGDGM